MIFTEFYLSAHFKQKTANFKKMSRLTVKWLGP